MNSSWVKSLLVIAPLSVVLTLSSCGSSATPPFPPPPQRQWWSRPASTTVLSGQSQQFVAQVSGLTDKTVTWQVEGSGGAPSLAPDFTLRPWTAVSPGYHHCYRYN